MKKYIIILLFVFPLFSCGTKYNYLDTGVSDPHFEGDMYAYLQSNSYNWDSIVKIIDRARLQDVFRHDDITFMGLTNHSIRQWLIQGGKGYEAGYRQVTDIPEAMCRTIVLSLVIDGGMLRDDIERIELNEKGEYINHALAPEVIDELRPDLPDPLRKLRLAVDQARTLYGGRRAGAREPAHDDARSGSKDPGGDQYGRFGRYPAL